MFKKNLILFFVLIIFCSCENTLNTVKNTPDNEKPDKNTEPVDSEKHNDYDILVIDEDEFDSEQEEFDDESEPDSDSESNLCSQLNDCKSTEICLKEIGKCNDTWGECTKIPDKCESEDEPVCGCDNISYANICEAMKNSQNIKYMGECK